MASKQHPTPPASALYFLYVLCFNLYVTIYNLNVMTSALDNCIK